MSVYSLIEGNHKSAEAHRMAYGKAMYNQALKEMIDWIEEVENSVFALSAPKNELDMLSQFKVKCKSLIKQP